MSNELAILIQTNQPAYAMTTTGEKDDLAASLAGAGAGVKRISIKGGVWRLMQGKNELGVNDARFMRVVIVDAAPRAYQAYYKGKFVEGQNVSATCWSKNGQTPEPEVVEKQSASCATCPQAIKGSSEGDRRACRMQHRLAVALPDDPTGDLYQMIFPATSLLGDPAEGQYPLRAYAKMVAQNKVRMNSIITEMRFDTNSATPKVMFKPVGFVEKDVLDLLNARRDAGECEELIDMTFEQIANDEPFETLAPPAHAQAAAPAPVAAPVHVQSVVHAAIAAAPVAAAAVVGAAPVTQTVPEPTPMPTAAAPEVTDKQRKLAEALAKFKKTA